MRLRSLIIVGGLIGLVTIGSQFKSIVIYCVPFHVVFATATLG